MTSQKTDKQALQEWDDLLESIRNSTPVDINESPKDKASRIAEVEKDFEKWVKYYFPKYCKESSTRIFNAKKGF